VGAVALLLGQRFTQRAVQLVLDVGSLDAQRDRVVGARAR
jgi:hypothetical protein